MQPVSHMRVIQASDTPSSRSDSSTAPAAAADTEKGFVKNLRVCGISKPTLEKFGGAPHLFYL
jgi:hypothetical protein